MKKTFAMLLALAMMLSLLAGCAKDPAVTPDPTPTPTPPPTPDNPNPTPTPDPTPVKTEPYGTLRDYTTTEITNLYPGENGDSDAGDIISGTLMKPYIKGLDANGKIVWIPELMTELPVCTNGDEGTVWRMTMKQGLKWQNGDPITADDLIYSAKVCLDPKLGTRRASSMASNYITLVGAEDYYTGKGDWESVGFKKIDDYTIEVTAAEFAGQEDLLRHFSAKWWCLVHEETFEKCWNEDKTANTYGTSVDKWMSCGRFILSEFVPAQHITMTRNPDYFDQETIKIETYNMRVVKDSNTALELFLNGELDRVGLSAAAKEQYEDDPRILMSPGSATYVMNINRINPNQNGLLGNLNFRQALMWAVDRASIGKIVRGIGANYILGQKCMGDDRTGTMYRDLPEAKAILPGADTLTYDVTKAKQYYDAAMKELGLTSCTVSLLFSETSTNNKAVCEFLEKQWEQTFPGMDVQLNAQSSAVAKSMRKGFIDDPTSYEITISGWDTSAECPWNAMKVYCSWYGGSNDPIYDEVFDAMWEDANNSKQSKIDLDYRLEKTIAMEKYALEDAFVVPLYETPSYQLCSEKVNLPVENYITGFGWGWLYCTIAK